MASSLLQTDVAAHPILAAGQYVSKLEAWAEAERERIGLWAPVALGLGIVAWFALPNSLYWVGWILLCCGMAVAMPLVVGGERLRALILWAGLLMAAGCALVWTKALLVGQPPLQRTIYAAFTAEVVAVQSQPALSRTRLMLEPVAQGHGGLPARVRLNVADKDMPHEGVLGTGAIVAVRARLMPPPPPAVPGAYDFAEHAYFSGIGATGRALPPVTVVRPAAPSGMA